MSKAATKRKSRKAWAFDPIKRWYLDASKRWSQFKKEDKVPEGRPRLQGALSRRYRLAKQYYIRSGVAYAGRKIKKRDFRKLWITRINAGARIAGTKYNDLIHGLKIAGVNINRKMLADLAVNASTLSRTTANWPNRLWPKNE